LLVGARHRAFPAPGCRLPTNTRARCPQDLVKTTLGPKGMDKILQSISTPNGDIQVTNDGATILRSIIVDNPCAKVGGGGQGGVFRTSAKLCAPLPRPFCAYRVCACAASCPCARVAIAPVLLPPCLIPFLQVLVDIARIQDDEVGDGTTSVTVLAGELLREAEKLIAQRIHPTTIIEGWRRAAAVARAALEASSLDHGADPVAFRADLLNIARTTLSSKLLTHEKDQVRAGRARALPLPRPGGAPPSTPPPPPPPRPLLPQFATLAVEAVLRIRKNLNLDLIQVIKKPGGSLRDSYLEEGFILNKSIGVGQPKTLRKARILLANTPMDTDKVKIFGTKVRVDSMAKVAEIEAAEKERMKAKVAKIVGHGINCFINRQLIYNYPEQLFAEAGVMAIEHADFDGIERLAAVTGGEIASTFEHPELVALGEVDLIEEIIIGEDRMIRFSGVKAGEACT